MVLLNGEVDLLPVVESHQELLRGVIVFAVLGSIGEESLSVVL